MNRDKVFGILLEQVGDGYEKLLELLLNQKGFVSGEKLAKQTGLKVNEVRKVLYKLYKLRYCEYKRTQRPDGWFVYFWKLNPARVIEEFNSAGLEKLRELQAKLAYEQNHQFFRCVNECSILTYKDALDTDFICPECGGVLKRFDNSEKIQMLQNQINDLKKRFNL